MTHGTNDTALASEQHVPDVWPVKKVKAWFDARPWLCGFNYVPHYAINSTEMWQHEDFDPRLIGRELGWAREIGFNACRVFLPFVVWQADPSGFLSRFGQFLEIADHCGLVTLPIFFDDCAFADKEPHLGRQDDPVAGVHNSGWTPSPGPTMADDPSQWPVLERYVQSLIGAFGQDRRVLAWDIYNEPGNSQRGDRSIPLLNAAFRWARAANPSQPLTCAIWHPDLTNLNHLMGTRSDAVSFHDYGDLSAVQQLVKQLEGYGRPILCTEWMRRPFGSHFDTHLPFFAEKRIGAYSWGLVNGKTQTHLPWGSNPGSDAPAIWFHDLLQPDGTPYDPADIKIIWECLNRANGTASLTADPDMGT